MTRAPEIVPYAGEDRREEPVPGDRDPRIVTRSGLLAEKMPSFLVGLGKLRAVTIAELRQV